MDIQFPLMPERRYEGTSRTALSDQLRKKENITTNAEYRTYLQKNAGSIMTFNKSMAQQHVGPSFRTN